MIEEETKVEQTKLTCQIGEISYELTVDNNVLDLSKEMLDKDHDGKNVRAWINQSLTLSLNMLPDDTELSVPILKKLLAGPNLFHSAPDEMKKKILRIVQAGNKALFEALQKEYDWKEFHKQDKLQGELNDIKAKPIDILSPRVRKLSGISTFISSIVSPGSPRGTSPESSVKLDESPSIPRNGSK